MQTFCCHIKILLNYLTKIVSTVFTHLHFFSFFTFLTCLSLLFYTSLPTSIPLCESPSKLSSFTLLYFVTYLHTFMWSLRTVLDLTTALTIIPLCESPSKFAFLYSSILHYLPTVAWWEFKWNCYASRLNLCRMNGFASRILNIFFSKSLKHTCSSYEGLIYCHNSFI